MIRGRVGHADFADITHTNGTVRGLYVVNDNVVTAGTAYGAEFDLDIADANNAHYGLFITKDNTTTAIAGTTLTNSNDAILIDITESNIQTGAGSTLDSSMRAGLPSLTCSFTNWLEPQRRSELGPDPGEQDHH